MKRFRFLRNAAGVTVSLRNIASPLRSFVEKEESYYCKTLFSQFSVVSEAENDPQQPAAFLRRRNNLTDKAVVLHVAR